MELSRSVWLCLALSVSVLCVLALLAVFFKLMLSRGSRATRTYLAPRYPLCLSSSRASFVFDCLTSIASGLHVVWLCRALSSSVGCCLLEFCCTTPAWLIYNMVLSAQPCLSALFLGAGSQRSALALSAARSAMSLSAGSERSALSLSTVSWRWL